MVCCNETHNCFCSLGVVKRIIPAVASTNAVIAGKECFSASSCCYSEVLMERTYLKTNVTFLEYH